MTLKFSVSSRWPPLPEKISSDLFSHAKVLNLKAGDLLFEAGNEGDGCYRVDEGTLKVILTSPQGETRILALVTPGEIVGDLSMIDGLPRSASVVAVSDTQLRFVSRSAFAQCVERHPELYRYLTSLLASRLREADETIAALAFLTVKGRVAHALLEIAKGLGEETSSGGIVIRKMVSQKELAAMAGVARENVNRVLSDWKRREMVIRSDDGLHILDKSALEREITW